MLIYRCKNTKRHIPDYGIDIWHRHIFNKFEFYGIKKPPRLVALLPFNVFALQISEVYL